MYTKSELRQAELEPDACWTLGTAPGLDKHYHFLVWLRYWDICWTRYSTQIHTSLLGVFGCLQGRRTPQKHHTHLKSNHSSLTLAPNLTP